MTSKLDLTNTTLVAISSNKIKETLQAIDICKKYANFYKIVLFSDCDTQYTHHITAITSILEYNLFAYYELPQYIDSDYILNIHWDGFIVNPEAWTNEFYNYDYIGAPWPWNNLCGNSGFCMRSKKFLQTQLLLSRQHKLEIDDEHGKHGLHDDVMLCLKLRNKFIENGCRYAPENIGYKFSTEYGVYDHYRSFGFHDFRQQPQFKNLIYG